MEPDQQATPASVRGSGHAVGGLKVEIFRVGGLKFDIDAPDTWETWAQAALTNLAFTTLLEYLGAAIVVPGTTRRFNESLKRHRHYKNAVWFLIQTVNDANRRLKATGHLQLNYVFMGDVEGLVTKRFAHWYLQNGSFLSQDEMLAGGHELPPYLPLDAAIERNKAFHNFDPVEMNQDESIVQVLNEIVRRGLEVAKCTIKYSVEARELQR